MREEREAVRDVVRRAHREHAAAKSGLGLCEGARHAQRAQAEYVFHGVVGDREGEGGELQARDRYDEGARVVEEAAPAVGAA